MRSVEEMFRRLAIGDVGALASLSDPTGTGRDLPRLDVRTEALLRIASLIALGAPASAYRGPVDDAEAAGAARADLLAVLACIVGDVGTAHVVEAAPRLALATGYDVDVALEERDPGQEAALREQASSLHRA